MDASVLNVIIRLVDFLQTEQCHQQVKTVHFTSGILNNIIISGIRVSKAQEVIDKLHAFGESSGKLISFSINDEISICLQFDTGNLLFKFEDATFRDNAGEKVVEGSKQVYAKEHLKEFEPSTRRASPLSTSVLNNIILDSVKLMPDGHYKFEFYLDVYTGNYQPNTIVLVCSLIQ